MSMDGLFNRSHPQSSSFVSEEAFSSLVNRSGAVEFVPVADGNKAQECPAYLSHILRNYHNLPDVSIFLHSNPFNHKNPYILQDIRYVLDHCKPHEIGFLHLNDYPICRPGQWRSGEDVNWATAWELLGFERTIMPKKVQTMCCAQFLVTRERILLRSRWFYEQLLKITYQMQKCAFQEHYWHIFFGEHHSLPKERSVSYYRKRSVNGDVLGEWKSPRNASVRRPYLSKPVLERMANWYNESIADPTYYHPLTESTCSGRNLH